MYPNFLKFESNACLEELLAMAASMKMHALPAMTACIACMPVVVEGNTCNDRRRFFSAGIACNKTILAALM